MSIETWKRQFYPVEAETAAKQGAKAATIHSIRKWEGLRPDVLEKHGVSAAGSTLADDQGSPGFAINGETCALCVAFLGRDGNDCKRCPLYKARDKRRCDIAMIGHEVESPYCAWIDHSDPEPMIAWLGKALAEGKA